MKAKLNYHKVRDELEARAKEFKQLSSDLEDVQQKLIDNIHDRSKPEQDSVASILIRNKDIADQAAAIVRSRGKFSIDGIQARNIVTLDGLPSNTQFAFRDNYYSHTCISFTGFD